jgi:hypothetical protein
MNEARPEPQAPETPGPLIRLALRFDSPNRFEQDERMDRTI